MESLPLSGRYEAEDSFSLFYFYWVDSALLLKSKYEGLAYWMVARHY
jgi:hypothetical protein